MLQILKCVLNANRENNENDGITIIWTWIIWLQIPRIFGINNEYWYPCRQLITCSSQDMQVDMVGGWCDVVCPPTPLTVPDHPCPRGLNLMNSNNPICGKDIHIPNKELIYQLVVTVDRENLCFIEYTCLTLNSALYWDHD